MSALIRVLVAVDHSVVRRGLAMLLVARHGMQMVGEAVDGEDAIVKARQLRPDVIVMDLIMPKLDGIEAIRRIRDEEPAMRILLLTTFEEDSMVIEALSAGALGHLGKDSSTDELLHAIRKVAGGISYMPPDAVTKPVLEMQKQSRNMAIQTALSEREIDLPGRLETGMHKQPISENLLVRVSTVRTHIRALLVKLGVSSRTQAALYAIGTAGLLTHRYFVGH
jgi:DNA-binding NarL/FixJ family response regulator